MVKMRKMTLKKQPTKTRFAVIFGGMFALTLIGILFGLAWPTTMIKAGPTLPPRELPSKNQPADSDDDDSKPLLAHIELHAQNGPAGVWSVVQWQDSDGNWHDVEGWRGVLNNGYQRWAVEAKNFNTGPFRWQVRRGIEGEILGISDPFSLPAGVNQVVSVQVE